MTNFNIKVVSDTVCPWCYVGKNRLDQAIAEYKAKHPESQDTFSTEWLPFQLNPDAPKTGVDKTQYYKNKFGEVQTDMIFQRLAQAGQDSGIDFKFGGRTGNTRDSHRLIQLAKEKGEETQTRVVEELFKAYFENEQDITSHEVLETAATRGGLDREEVRAWLESDKGGKEVDAEVAEAKASLVSGVPNFTIQDQFEISGAQEPRAFVHLFERIKSRM